MGHLITQAFFEASKKLCSNLCNHFLKKEYLIGLDIGSSSIKLVQFIEKEDGLHLVKADLKEIKQSDDDSLNESEIISALKGLFRGIDVKKSKIIANINCPQTAMNKITTPYIPRLELRQGIILEAKNYFPFPVDQSRLDFEILGDVVEKGVRKYEVIVAVSPKKTVDKYLSLLEKAGLKPDAFVSSGYALQKIAQETLSTKEGQIKCLVDIGKSHTELIICKGGYLLFSRKIPVVGNDFTKAMTGALVSDRGKIKLSLAGAEKIKCEIGIPPEGKPRIINDKISTAQILAMLRQPIEQLISEIERCFDYYREENAGGKVNSLVLFGGGASLGGIVRALSEGLGIEVKIGDPLEGLKIEPKAVDGRSRISYQLSCAIGAALSETKGINLLPEEIKEQTKRTFKHGTLEGIAVAIILILLFTFIGMKIQLSNFQKRISVANLELASLQPELKVAQALALADTLLVNEPYWEDIFKELGNLIPAYIYLTNFNMQNNVITMKGIVASSHDAMELVSDFTLVLEKGIFNNARLVGTKVLGENAGTEFELKCWVDYE